MRILPGLVLLLPVSCTDLEERPQIPPTPPLTAIAITHCSEIVAIYITAADGKLIRIDKDSGVTDGAALDAAQMALTARRLEIGCNGETAAEGSLR